jgi:hypothetical protein
MAVPAEHAVPGMAECNCMMSVFVNDGAVPATQGFTGLPGSVLIVIGTGTAGPIGAFGLLTRRLPAVIGSWRRSTVQREWSA